MRKIYLLLLPSVFAACTVCYTPKVIQGRLNGVNPLKKGFVYYSKVIPVGGLSKEEIFRRARRWIALHYNSAKAATQLEDKDSGDLVSNTDVMVTIPAANRYDLPQPIHISFAFSIEAKADRFRLEATRFRVLSFVDRNPIETPLEQYCRMNEKLLTASLEAIDNRVGDIFDELQIEVRDAEEW